MRNLSKQLEKEPIAIVGMSGIFPKAKNIIEFWNNILNKRDCISDVPKNEGYWSIEDYFDPDPKAVNKTFCKKGGFIPPVSFDPLHFGITPLDLDAISSFQLFALLVAEQALKDAKLLIEDTTEEQREKIGVVIGEGTGNIGDVGSQSSMIPEIPRWKRVLKNTGLPDSIIENILKKISQLYPQAKHDTFPGFLSNIATGRIASRFDLRGPNYTLDAACASGLLAIKLSISELLEGSCDTVLTGSINIDTSISAFIGFKEVMVLSQKGICRPFDADADGIMLGDACAMMVLKRLSDAEKQGDRIYALIKGIGVSSDGRGKSINAPNLEGQISAINRAYENCSVKPAEIGLIEAHGTGTQIGDPIEFKALCSVFDDPAIKKGSIAINSLKAQVGHLRSSAGTASAIKVALALHNKTLTPMNNVNKPNRILEIEKSPFYLNTSLRPWTNCSLNKTRKAAVSSSGFGGINAHLVMEEYTGENQADFFCVRPQPIFLQEKNAQKLADKISAYLNLLDNQEYESLFEQLKKSLNKDINPEEPRIGFIAKDFDEIKKKLETSKDILNNRFPDEDCISEIFFSSEAISEKPKVIGLFPGQGSEYINMGVDMVCHNQNLIHLLEKFDLEREKQGQSWLSSALYPIAVFDKESQERQKETIIDTMHAQPAVGFVSLALLQSMVQYGLLLDYALGHGLGELTSLCAAKALSEDDFIRLSVARGRIMGQVESKKDAALEFSREIKQTSFKGPKNPVISNVNQRAYPKSKKKIQELLSDQMLAPVNFKESLNYILQKNEPVIFLEIGPKSVLSQMVKEVDVHAKSKVISFDVSTDVSTLGDWDTKLYTALVRLKVFGVSLSNFSTNLFLPEKVKLSPMSITLDGGIKFEKEVLEKRVDALYNYDNKVVNQWINEIKEQVQAAKAPQDDTRLTAQSSKDKPTEQIPYSTPYSMIDVQKQFFDIQAKFLNTIDALGNSQQDYAANSLTRTQQNLFEVQHKFLDHQTLALDYQTEALAGETRVPPILSPKPALKGPAQPPLTQFPSSDPLHNISENMAEDTTPQKQPNDRSKLPIDESGKLDKEQIESVLLKVIENATGYTQDLIDFDMDMESDLGIDSIKRFEIFMRFNELYPEIQIEEIIDDTEFIEIKTLNQVISALEKRLLPAFEPDSDKSDSMTCSVKSEPEPDKSDCEADPVKQDSTAINESSFEQTPFKYQMHLKSLPLFEKRDDFWNKSRTWLIVQQKADIAASLSDKLVKYGQKVILLLIAHRRSARTSLDPSVKIYSISSMNNEKNFEEDLKEIIMDNSEINGCIIVQDSAGPVKRLTDGFAKRNFKFQARVFLLTKVLQEFFIKKQGSILKFFITLSESDGKFGLSGKKSFQFMRAGISGFLKTVAREWPEVVCKHIDTDKNLNRKDSADIILNEITAPDKYVEVSLPNPDQRYTLTLKKDVNIPDSLNPDIFSEQDIILVAGGARGITASCVIELAKIVPLTFVLLGRTPIDNDEPKWADGLENEVELTQQLIAETKEKGETISPIQATRQANRILNVREIRNTLDILSELGAAAYYFDLDILDRSKTGQTIKWIQKELGKIVSIIHGAGVLADKLIKQKSLTDFNLVVKTKILGLQNILGAVKIADLKRIILFSSISGFFGNAGQADYALANEILNKFALMMGPAYPNIKTTAIGWGPWKGGMMTSGLQKAYDRQHIPMIPVQKGVEFFCQEFLNLEEKSGASLYFTPHEDISIY